MTERVIINVDQVTPEWLTDVLKRSGAPAAGRDIDHLKQVPIVLMLPFEV